MVGSQMMKMREILEKIVELTAPCEGVTSIELQVQAEALTALSEPPRNCDVGTEEEQKYRFKAYCDKHYDLIEHRGCEGCPARNYIAGWGVPYCQLRWSQMPYEAQNGGEE